MVSLEASHNCHLLSPMLTDHDHSTIIDTGVRSTEKHVKETSALEREACYQYVYTTFDTKKLKLDLTRLQR
jgi:hypothetical protein